MSNLFVLSEDTVGIERYLALNGLYPSRIAFTTAEILQELPYADKDTVFLIIIHSFSRFNIVTINKLLAEFNAFENPEFTVVLMSDVVIKSRELKTDLIQFVRYTGDLFFGTYFFFRRNKEIANTIKEDEINKDILNGRVKPDKAKNTHYRENFWRQFGEFTDPSVLPIIDAKPAPTQIYTDSDTKFVDSLKTVTLNLKEGV